MLSFCQFADNMSETFMFNDALAKQNITVRLCFFEKLISLEMIKVVKQRGNVLADVHGTATSVSNRTARGFMTIFMETKSNKKIN